MNLESRRLVARLLALIPVPFLLGGSCARPNLHAVDGSAYASYDASPDGTQIVFSGAGGGGKDLYLLDIIKRKVTRLTDTPEYENYPAFSPDCQTIVYQSAKNLDSPRTLFLRSLDGSSVRRLTGGDMVADSYPSFSRDGKRVVFARAHMFRANRRGENTWDQLDVYTINIDGTDLKRLTHGNYGGEIRPKFSPDGTYVLFEETTPYPAISMYISRVDASGRGPVRRVTHLGESDGFPYFFPDGQRIVFMSNTGGLFDLYVMAITGGTASCLHTYAGGNAGIQPTVVAGGKAIIYLRGGIWRMDADGKHQSEIADQSLFDAPMSFTAD